MPKLQAICLVLLLASSQLASAQLQRPRLPTPKLPTPKLPSPRLINPFKGSVGRRSRLAAQQQQQQQEAPAPAGAAVPELSQQPSAQDADMASSSSSSSTAVNKSKCPRNWALKAIEGSSSSSGSSGSDVSAKIPAVSSSGSTLPTSTDHVLICLISSGVHKDSPVLKHNRWTGCTKEDPLDPTGCTLSWATQPPAAGFKPRGTWLASLIAANGGGIIPGATDIHVVPVDSPGTGSVDPASSAPSGKSRLRAYSVCEGRLRGLQATDYGSTSVHQQWRMVMLVDVAADKPANSGTGEYALSEADWVKVATGTGTVESPHAPDVLIIAPTGHNAAVGYPAALPGVFAVGGYKCTGEPLHAHTDTSSSSSSSSKPDILAPGGNIAIPGTDKVWSDDAAAAAFVAGAAARLWTAYPNCSAEDIRVALSSSSGSSSGPATLSLAAAQAALKLNKCAAGGINATT